MKHYVLVLNGRAIAGVPVETDTKSNSKNELFCIPEVHIQNLEKKYKSTEQLLAVMKEELSELIQALCKYDRHISAGEYDLIDVRSKIIEEYTHVCAEMESIRRYFGISQSEIDREILRKALREGYDIHRYPDRFQKMLDNE